MKFFFNFVKSKQKQDFLHKVTFQYKGNNFLLIIDIHMIIFLYYPLLSNDW